MGHNPRRAHKHRSAPVIRRANRQPPDQDSKSPAPEPCHGPLPLACSRRDLQRISAFAGSRTPPARVNPGPRLPIGPATAGVCRETPATPAIETSGTVMSPLPGYCKAPVCCIRVAWASPATVLPAFATGAMAAVRLRAAKAARIMFFIVILHQPAGRGVRLPTAVQMGVCGAINNAAAQQWTYAPGGEIRAGCTFQGAPGIFGGLPRRSAGAVSDPPCNHAEWHARRSVLRTSGIRTRRAVRSKRTWRASWSSGAARRGRSPRRRWDAAAASHPGATAPRRR